MEHTDYIGEIVQARCEEVGEKRVVFKFADKEWAFVPRNECPSIKSGDVVPLYVDGVAKNGMWACSVEKVQTETLLQQIKDARENKTDLNVQVVSVENNGLFCDVMGLAAFMPRREVEDSPHLALESYVGQTIRARIIKLSQSDGSIIVSHRAAVAEQQRASREKLLSQLKPEQIYEGTVRQIVDFGVFVDIGAGVEGLVHRSNLSWDNQDPAAVVVVGSKLRVVVLSVEAGKISLGHKQLIEDDWATAAQALAVGSIVEGKVTTFANFGAFVRVCGKFEGLVHNSELSWDPAVRSAKQVMQLNDIVNVKVIGIDVEKRKLRLSLRQVAENPWEDVARRYPVGSVHKLKIVSIADFGLFVDLGSGRRGLIHKRDLRWDNANVDLDAEYKNGDEIECKVLDVDVEKARAAFGVKQLSGDPWAEFVAQKPVGKQFDATISRIAKFGAFAKIGDVDGLIHISELSEDRVTNVGAVVKVGQNVKVTVIGLDDSKRRLSLSLTADPFDPEVSEERTGTNENAHATLADVLPEALKQHQTVLY